MTLNRKISKERIVKIIEEECDLKGYCVKFNKELAEILGVSPGTASKYINQLHDEGKIYIHFFGEARGLFSIKQYLKVFGK